MQPLGLHYFPLAPPFFLVLIGLLLLVSMGFLDFLRYVYVSIGVTPKYVFTVLALTLAGSYINIPVMQFPHERLVSAQEVIYFGIRYVVPVVRDWPGTILAVNVGGAIIPVLASLFLLAKHRLYWGGVLATLVTTAVCFTLAQPEPGIGIAIPTFVPPLAAAVTALLLSRRDASALAYIGGSLGTLLGADLFNLRAIRGLGAPVASIGGAGTFDGIFVTGLMAVLLTSLINWSGWADAQRK